MISTKDIANSVDAQYTHVTEDMAMCRMENLDLNDLEKALKDDTKYVNDFGDYGCVLIENPRQLVEGKINHIMRPEFTGVGENKKYKGLHSIYELDEDAYAIEFLTSGNYTTEPYEALIYVSENILEGGTYGEAIIKRSPENKSSMFPDSWSRSKIIDEVTYAVRYNNGKKDPNATGQAANVFVGSIGNNIHITFVYINESIILTYYPLID